MEYFFFTITPKFSDPDLLQFLEFDLWFKEIWFVGWIFSYINLCWLSNAKFCLCVYWVYIIWKQVQIFDQTVLYLTTHFNASHLFGHCLNVKQFYFTKLLDTITSYHSKSKWPVSNWKQGNLWTPQISKASTLPSDCLGSYQDTHSGLILPFCRDTFVVFDSPSRLG